MPVGTADAAVGMMDGAYFVGRKELLDFFNDLLDLQYTKIEQTATGAMACQITALIFPNTIPMSRVNWAAKADFEFVANYKLLQNAFNKHKVQRYVDVDKLIRAKYQDNLEFCQWLKAFYDQSGAVRPADYDPTAVRARGKGGARFNQQFGRKRGSSRSSNTVRTAATTTTRPTAAAATQKPTATNKSAVTTASAAATSRGSRPLRDRDNAANRSSNNNKTTTDTAKPGPTAAQLQTLQTQNQTLTTRVTELEESLVALEEERDTAIIELEKERDFYFTKLRDVEVMLQIHQEMDGGSGDIIAPAVLDELFKVLYATAEQVYTVADDGTVVFDEDNPGVAAAVTGASDSFDAAAL